MKYLLHFCRLFVGSLFIVSGLIKANDPLGFSYKLEEYFHESALNLPFFEPWSLELGVIACLAEIILGFALLFGAKIRLATWSLLGLTLFFGWLTAYTATCDPTATYTVMENGVEVTKNVTCVTDCGCFGDAMKGSVGRSLTPWESFSKDMVLLVFLLPIFIFQKRVKLNSNSEDIVFLGLSTVFVIGWSWVFGWYFPVAFLLFGFVGFIGLKKLLAAEKSEWPGAGWVLALSLGFVVYCINYLPLKDYRPYAIGKNIEEGMKSAEELGLEPPKYGYNYTMVNLKTKEEKVITDKQYLADKWWENKEWEMNTDKTEHIKISDGYEPPIHDFYISDANGYDQTQTILKAPKIVLMIAYDIRKTSESQMPAINALAEGLKAKGIPFAAVSAGVYKDIEAFRHKHQTLYDFWSGDAIMLKTIIRSNPGIIVLENGTVTAKYSVNSLPQLNEI